MAEDSQLPGGARKKLSRLVAGHLWWFDAAERRGMSWRDMTLAMAAAGMTGSGTKPVSVGTLSSTVWRARFKAEEANGARTQQRLGRAPIPHGGNSQKSTLGRGIARTQQDGQTTFPQKSDGAQVNRTAAKRSTGENRLGPPNKGMLAFMDRARAVRRRSEDD